MLPGELKIVILLLQTAICIENNSINITIKKKVTLSRKSDHGKINFDEQNIVKFQDIASHKIIKESNNKIRFDDNNIKNGYGLFQYHKEKIKPIKFISSEDQIKHDAVETYSDNHPIQGFENQLGISEPIQSNNIIFHDEDLNDQEKKKKRRRRRKPRLQNFAAGNFIPDQQIGNNQYASTQGHSQVGYGHYPGYGFLESQIGYQQKPGFSGVVGPYKGFRKRPPGDALSSITEALSSIARYDDFQCVPRLLCEMAGGRSPVQNQGSELLQTMVNLQPLVTLLAAYNGVGTSPLFVFGRAVILGMSSRGSSSTCQSSYPLCPRDPEKLVEYLNNHNGGFFRFFNNPQLGQPNQHLFNQNSGAYGYGLYQNGYGHYMSPEINGNHLNSNLNSAQVFLNQNYDLNNQYYGLAKRNSNNETLKDDENVISLEIEINKNNIQDRIVNRKDDRIMNWSFPEENSFQDDNVKIRSGKSITFPDDGSKAINAHIFKFPEKAKSNFYFENNFFATPKNENFKMTYTEDEIVYILRGNTDPNMPEIIKVKKGKKVF